MNSSKLYRFQQVPGDQNSGMVENSGEGAVV